VATFVFCSVPDPVRGLRELNRVVRPGGQILLLEHVRIDGPVIGRLMDWLNPLMVRIWGASLNRPTVQNVQRAGLDITTLEHLGPMEMVKLMIARPDKPKGQVVSQFHAQLSKASLTR
jgi:ubiquinone/menaquinone biosynthesis C-methylase UbiE